MVVVEMMVAVVVMGGDDGGGSGDGSSDGGDGGGGGSDGGDSGGGSCDGGSGGEGGDGGDGGEGGGDVGGGGDGGGDGDSDHGDICSNIVLLSICSFLVMVLSLHITFSSSDPMREHYDNPHFTDGKLKSLCKVTRLIDKSTFNPGRLTAEEYYLFTSFIADMYTDCMMSTNCLITASFKRWS